MVHYKAVFTKNRRRIHNGKCSAGVCKYQCFTVLATKKMINVRIHHPWPIVNKRTEKSIN